MACKKGHGGKDAAKPRKPSKRLGIPLYLGDRQWECYSSDGKRRYICTEGDKQWKIDPAWKG